MKNLLIILPFLSFAQQVVNDTLVIQDDELIQKVTLLHRKTGARYNVLEVDFNVYRESLSGYPKGLYTVMINKNDKIYVNTIENSCKYAENNAEHIRWYYFVEVARGRKTEGYIEKAEVVNKINKYKTDKMLKDGKQNTLKIYMVLDRDKGVKKEIEI